MTAGTNSADAWASVEIVAPAGSTPETLRATPSLQPFSQPALTFAAALSEALLRSPGARAFPELVALAFWLRRANVERLVAEFRRSLGGRTVVPRGLALHITPANVDTIFVYSWIVSLLVGNLNLVRISSRGSRQVALLVDAITGLLAGSDHVEIRERTLLVRYARSDAVTAGLSRLADLRVLWGGDETVLQVRAIPISPRAIDVSFPDRFSFAVIRAEAWLEATREHAESAARAFVNDAYWFGQMACSSPRMVVWVGDDLARVTSAREGFWRSVRAHLAPFAAGIEDADFMNKLVAGASAAILHGASVAAEPDRVVTRAWFGEAPTRPAELHCGGGLFWETSVASLDAALAIADPRTQTISYFGFQPDDFRAAIDGTIPSGVDRVVPFGRALDFSIVWDGIDLLRAFTREIAIS